MQKLTDDPAWLDGLIGTEAPVTAATVLDVSISPKGGFVAMLVPSK